MDPDLRVNLPFLTWNNSDDVSGFFKFTGKTMSTRYVISLFLDFLMMFLFISIIFVFGFASEH